MVTRTGNTIFSVLETGRSWVILTLRISLVVSSFIMGGWIRGISAIYEYAAMAMAGSRSTASLEEVRMAVGPSAPPMTPMAAA